MSEPTPWLDAYERVNTTVSAMDADYRFGATVAEILEDRVRTAFAHLAAASPRLSPPGGDQT